MANYRPSKRVRLSRRRKNKRRSRRRSTRKYRLRKQIGVSGIKSLFGANNGPFPNTLKTRFTWSYPETFTTGVVSGISRDFRLNSLYDPYFPVGSTGQPRFFDTFFGANNTTAPYSHYRVYRTHYRLEVVNNGSDSFYLCVFPFHGGSTAPATLAEARMRSDCKLTYVDIVGSGKARKFVSGNVNIAKLASLKSVLDDADDLAGNSAADPANEVYLNYKCFPALGDFQPAISVSVTLTFATVCLNRLDVADS